MTSERFLAFKENEMRLQGEGHHTTGNVYKK